MIQLLSPYDVFNVYAGFHTPLFLLLLDTFMCSHLLVICTCLYTCILALVAKYQVVLLWHFCQGRYAGGSIGKDVRTYILTVLLLGCIHC